MHLRLAFCPLTFAPDRRGGRAVECAGLENRYGRFRPSRVRIPPSPLNRLSKRVARYGMRRERQERSATYACRRGHRDSVWDGDLRSWYDRKADLQARAEGRRELRELPESHVLTARFDVGDVRL